MGNFLYRGVCEEIFKKNKGLAPKGTSFSRAIKYGTGFKYGTITYGSSELNAVVSHQKNSSQFPTSGISTTPILDRAKYYALADGAYNRGYVYKIDKALLKQFKVKEYRVTEHISTPEIPEDDEVILVSEDDNALPQEVVVEIIEVLGEQKITRHPKSICSNGSEIGGVTGGAQDTRLHVKVVSGEKLIVDSRSLLVAR